MSTEPGVCLSAHLLPFHGPPFFHIVFLSYTSSPPAVCPSPPPPPISSCLLKPLLHSFSLVYTTDSGLEPISWCLHPNNFWGVVNAGYAIPWDPERLVTLLPCHHPPSCCPSPSEGCRSTVPCCGILWSINRQLSISQPAIDVCRAPGNLEAFDYVLRSSGTRKTNCHHEKMSGRNS